MNIRSETRRSLRFLMLSTLMLAACGQPVLSPASGPSASPTASAKPAESTPPSVSPPPLALPSATATPGLPVSLPSAEPASSAPPGKGPTKLHIDKTSYAAGEAITVSFNLDPESARDPHAWIGLLPADVPHGSSDENDKFDLEYQYLEGKNSGTLTFHAPDDPGDYDLRMHNAEAGGQELATVAFKVTGSARPLTGNAIRLNKSRFAPGETITITVSIKASDKQDETAWVGIVPSAVDHGSEALNDQHNLGYKYLGKSLYGQTTLPAPNAPGYYDLRLNDTDSDGKELAFVTFVVN